MATPQAYLPTADMPIQPTAPQPTPTAKTYAPHTFPGRDYWYNHQYLTATAHLSLTITKHTGSTQDIDIITSPLECTGSASPYIHTLPSGDICTNIAIKSCEITLNGEEAYTTGPVTTTSYPWTLHGVVSVTPEGTGEASVTPRTATYGQQVTFRALNTDPEYWRFTRWQSGEISPTYTVTVYADYSDTAIFADATKIIDFYIAASIDPDTQDIIFFIKTEYDRTDNPATVRFNLRYFYQDQTNILRSSIGYVVYERGEKVTEYFATAGSGLKGSGTEGIERGKQAANEAAREYPNDIVGVIVAGADYALYVESKGYDVLTGPASLLLTTFQKNLRLVFDSLKA